MVMGVGVGYLSARLFAVHMRIVPSSEPLASMPGTRGFQLTAFTVPLWPLRRRTGSDLSMFHITYVLI